MRAGLLFIILVLAPGLVLAVPPEGFENFALLNRGIATDGISAGVSYTNPIWTSDYESLEVVANSEFKNHLFTYGGRATVANKFGDRSAYFARFDFIFLPQTSLSIKWAHEDWKYIATGKDSFGAELNHYLKITETSGFYFVFGGYYRYLKQRWNPPWHSPFNYNTKDQEGYPTAAVGYKCGIDHMSFWTFDVNIRDTWGYYGLDSVAFDWKLYLVSRGLSWNITAGVRTGATWVGTMYPASYYIALGFSSF